MSTESATSSSRVSAIPDDLTFRSVQERGLTRYPARALAHIVSTLVCAIMAAMLIIRYCSEVVLKNVQEVRCIWICLSEHGYGRKQTSTVAGCLVSYIPLTRFTNQTFRKPPPCLDLVFFTRDHGPHEGSFFSPLHYQSCTFTRWTPLAPSAPETAD